MPYSFSEIRQKKGITVVELKEKGSLSVETIPLTPLRDMVEIKGKYDEIMLRDFYKDYILLVLDTFLLVGQLLVS